MSNSQNVEQVSEIDYSSFTVEQLAAKGCRNLRMFGNNYMGIVNGRYFGNLIRNYKELRDEMREGGDEERKAKIDAKIEEYSKYMSDVYSILDKAVVSRMISAEDRRFLTDPENQDLIDDFSFSKCIDGNPDEQNQFIAAQVRLALHVYVEMLKLGYTQSDLFQ